MMFPGKHSWVVLPVAPGQASGKHAGSVNQLIGFISLLLKLEFFFSPIMTSAWEEATFWGSSCISSSCLISSKFSLHTRVICMHKDQNVWLGHSWVLPQHQTWESTPTKTAWAVFVRFFFLFLILPLLLNSAAAAQRSPTPPSLARHYSALWQ